MGLRVNNFWYNRPTAKNYTIMMHAKIPEVMQSEAFNWSHQLEDMLLQKIPHTLFMEKPFKNMALKLTRQQIVVKARQMLHTDVSLFIIIFSLYKHYLA